MRTYPDPPDWETIYLAVYSRDPEARIRILEHYYEYIIARTKKSIAQTGVAPSIFEPEDMVQDALETIIRVMDRFKLT